MSEVQTVLCYLPHGHEGGSTYERRHNTKELFQQNPQEVYQIHRSPLLSLFFTQPAHAELQPSPYTDPDPCSETHLDGQGLLVLTDL